MCEAATLGDASHLKSHQEGGASCVWAALFSTTASSQEVEVKMGAAFKTLQGDKSLSSHERGVSG